MHGTDLGVMWRDSRGRTAIAFGDTYGQGWGGHGSGLESADRRLDILVHSSGTEVSDGLSIDDMVTDRPSHAKQFLGHDPAVPEVTMIPTAGVSVGSRGYIHYGSVRSRATGGAGPRTTTRISRVRRKRRCRPCLPTNTGRPRGGGLIPVRPSRCSPARRTNLPCSTTTSSAAGSRYTSTRAATRSSCARHPGPTGPWTGGQVVAAGTNHPGLYGAFVHPASDADLCFAMSEWDPYHVRLLRPRLPGLAIDPNLAQDGGFEDATLGPWRPGLDRGLGFGRGSRGFVVRGSSKRDAAVSARLGMRPARIDRDRAGHADAERELDERSEQSRCLGVFPGEQPGAGDDACVADGPLGTGRTFCLYPGETRISPSDLVVRSAHG